MSSMSIISLVIYYGNTDYDIKPVITKSLAALDAITEANPLHIYIIENGIYNLWCPKILKQLPRPSI